MEHDEFLQAIRSPFHFATCDAVLRGCKIIDISKPLQWRRLSKKVRSPLGPLCEGAPPAGGGGENCTAARNISGYGKVLSLHPFGAPLPLWRKRHLPRIGGVCLAEGGFSTVCDFFALRTKKSPTVRSRERWGQNAISRPLKRRRAKRQNGGAACYWQEPHRRGKQPVDGSRLVMVSRR